ncbi:MAG TPA: adenylate/guanylate cyclase domain-containing protein [Spirochaetota bacterium]|nr:adenylate/guanylate cyclase domain-containing protein [Spirochaetota bacterium]HOL56243.1 adenylate/guanylate cyclase domain-containing protein [Spirochaetota bacterium]HPP04150.1 adenylate/guanylate cyclase domain-containing protein [Spirochaetota bacterium]
MSNKKITKKEYAQIKIGNTRVVPVVGKIIFVFIILLFISNALTNYININFVNVELTHLMKDLLVKDLKELYFYCNNQYEIFQFNNDIQSCSASIEKKGKSQLQYSKSIALGIKEDGSLLFVSTTLNDDIKFDPFSVLKKIKDNTEDLQEGVIPSFKFNKYDYFGVYKYNKNWKTYIIRAEEKREFYKKTLIVFGKIILIIIVLTIVCSLLGTIFLRYILRYLKFITIEILEMIKAQELKIIDLSKAPNDDITLLGVAFNSLSSTINNLMHIFLKFVNKDIASKAYQEKHIRLEGESKELIMLFSDIKSFTFMTEQLGVDIIKILNLHYENTIRRIIKNNGVIGSIIGDALLAIFGIFEETKSQKAYDAIISAYEIQSVTEQLRNQIKKKKEELEKKGKTFSPLQEKIFKALMIEIGVGIDGGEVFYGTIGSNERMTNTVIGDPVNAASRLEGLTRIYKVPIICSEYVVNQIEKIGIEIDDQNSKIKNITHNDKKFIFVEIDTVLVKGKTQGIKIYWPVLKNELTEEMENNILTFSKALQLYYEGDWKSASNLFKKCKLPVAEVFENRIKGLERPEKWNGIWTMETK